MLKDVLQMRQKDKFGETCETFNENSVRERRKTVVNIRAEITGPMVCVVVKFVIIEQSFFGQGRTNTTFILAMDTRTKYKASTSVTRINQFSGNVAGGRSGEKLVRSGDRILEVSLFWFTFVCYWI